MGLFEHFPYTNFHDLNLDVILNRVKTAETSAIEAAEDAAGSHQQASEAVATANQAVATANQAVSSAQQAVTNAATSQTAAEASQAAAEASQTAAEAAQTAAEAAQTAAEAAQSAAEDEAAAAAASAASAAQSAAEAAASARLTFPLNIDHSTGTINPPASWDSMSDAEKRIYRDAIVNHTAVLTANDIGPGSGIPSAANATVSYHSEQLSNYRLVTIFYLATIGTLTPSSYHIATGSFRITTGSNNITFTSDRARTSVQISTT